MAIDSGLSHRKWRLSIAMLNYQRVSLDSLILWFLLSLPRHSMLLWPSHMYTLANLAERLCRSLLWSHALPIQRWNKTSCLKSLAWKSLAIYTQLRHVWTCMDYLYTYIRIMLRNGACGDISTTSISEYMGTFAGTPYKQGKRNLVSIDTSLQSIKINWI